MRDKANTARISGPDWQCNGKLRMGQTLVLRVAATAMAANGIWMVADPQSWYQSVPGVDLTGPLNMHFVQDVGVAFLTAAGAYVAALRWPGAAYPLSLIAVIWLAGHALIHLLGLLQGSLSAVHLLEDSVAIFLPTFVAMLLSLSLRNNLREGRALG